ncbi:slightly ste11-like protein [Ceratocystis pirilliformis]|uniref:Slightly ste11-like protein n=1 Tax=Ceratocystis pirilliformis TaxID=259994 RepID=A0ABR3YF75_9PEZI
MDRSPKQEARTPEYQRLGVPFLPIASAPAPPGHSGPPRSSTHQLSPHRSSYSPLQDGRAPLPSSRRRSFSTLNNSNNNSVMAAATTSNGNMVSRSYANMVNLSLNLQGSATSGQVPHSMTKDFPSFILYRQRHQAEIASQNPGLSNPELSKIIGGLWKDETEEVREQWKNLAEEEKLRHQRQYPDYRYQPRRGRTSGNRSAVEDPSGRCIKCGGRLSTIPHTPQTPFPSMGPHPSSHALTPQQREQHDEPRNIPNGPRHGHSHSNSSRSGGYYDIDEDGDMIMSPDNMSNAKRRRNNNGSYTAVSGSQSAHPASAPYSYQSESSSMMRYPPPSNFVASSGQPPSHHSQSTMRGPLPLPESSASSRQMPPVVGQPPKRRPLPSFPEPVMHSHSASTPCGPRFDASLKLPPLKTQIPADIGFVASAISDRSLDGPRIPDAAIPNHQEQNPEATIMAIPDNQKFEMINRVSSSLRSPPPGSKQFETRGRFVAIEGNAPQSVLNDASAAIEKWFADKSDLDLKIWSDSRPSDGSVAMAEADAEKAAISSSQEEFKTYLATIAKWHGYSQEVIKHITTKPKAKTRSPMEYKPNEIKQRGSSEPREDPTTNGPDSSADTQAKIPVALVSGGYRVTLSTRAALKIPINDAYAPLDHYQWMATMWRGIVGPDLTINVCTVKEKDFNPKCVFEQTGPNIMVIRIIEGQSLDDTLARRVGFEVAEWVRSVNLA